MQTAIHDPYAGVVPLALKAHIDRKARLDRFQMKAFAPLPIAPAPERIEIHEDPVDDTSIEVIACNGQVVILTENEVEEAHAIFERRTGGRPSIECIQRLACQHFNLSHTEFLSMRRTKSLVRPRQIAMFLAKELTHKSLPEIGRKFRGMDHTTVLHAIRKVAELIEVDDGMKAAVGELRSQILGEAQS
jgi:hypothetical protein